MQTHPRQETPGEAAERRPDPATRRAERAMAADLPHQPRPPRSGIQHGRRLWTPRPPGPPRAEAE